jgi:hypothetical protein
MMVGRSSSSLSWSLALFWFLSLCTKITITA